MNAVEFAECLFNSYNEAPPRKRNVPRWDALSEQVRGKWIAVARRSYYVISALRGPPPLRSTFDAMEPELVMARFHQNRSIERLEEVDPAMLDQAIRVLDRTIEAMERNERSTDDDQP